MELLSGLHALVDFPTQGNSCLNNVFTNRKDLFGKSYASHMLIKTALSSVIVPAGTKLKPIQCKISNRDRHEHRKMALFKAIDEEDWSDVLRSTNANEAVDKLELTIHNHMDRCVPQRKVTMSSYGPFWMSPLVKSLFKKKSRTLIACDTSTVEFLS